MNRDWRQWIPQGGDVLDTLFANLERQGPPPAADGYPLLGLATVAHGMLKEGGEVAAGRLLDASEALADAVENELEVIEQAFERIECSSPEGLRRLYEKPPPSLDKLVGLFVDAPWLATFAMLFHGAAIARAREPRRTQAFYPSVLLESEVLVAAAGSPSEPSAALVWNMVQALDPRTVDAVQAAARALPRGFSGETRWPTRFEVERLAVPLRALQPTWQRVAMALRTGLSRQGHVTAPLLRSVLGSEPSEDMLRTSAEMNEAADWPPRARLAWTLGWPERSNAILANLASERGWRRLYFAYLLRLLQGAQVKGRGGHGAIVEVTLYDLVPWVAWGLGRYLDEPFDLYEAERGLSTRVRQRLKNQRNRCLAGALDVFPDPCLDLFEEVHDLLWKASSQGERP